MPMPLWWGHVNKRVFNPRALKGDKWDVIGHVGRSSGQRYRTPLEAHETGKSIVFILVYGSKSDWVQNVMASGTATLERPGESLELATPRLIEEGEAWKLLSGVAKPPPKFLNVNEFLQMDVVGRAPIEKGTETNFESDRTS